MNVYIDYQLMARRIRKKRKELGLTQGKAAEMANLTEKYWSKIERAYGTISADVLLKISDALGVNTDYLISGTQKDTSIINFSGVFANKLNSLDEDKQNLVLHIVEGIINYYDK